MPSAAAKAYDAETVEVSDDHMSKRDQVVKKINIRVMALPAQRDRIDEAARLVSKSRSDFVLDAACERAVAVVKAGALEEQLREQMPSFSVDADYDELTADHLAEIARRLDQTETGKPLSSIIPLKKSARRTLAELLAATPPGTFDDPEAIAWDRTSAVGREWPNEDWDKPQTTSKQQKNEKKK